MVQLVGSYGDDRTSAVGVVLGPWRDMPGWWRILIKDEVVQWPENQLHLIPEDQLRLV